MGLLICLIILLILAIVFFITYPILKKKITYKNYNVFCSRKIRKISSKNNFKFLTNLKLTFYSGEQLIIDHVIFGKKYIYILMNYLFDGDINGSLENNSWIFKKRHNEGATYIDNISEQLAEKTRVFSAKISANSDLIVPVAIVNNDCEISVVGINKNNTFVVHYSYLKKIIKNLEARNIPDLNAEQVEIQYENLRKENEEK